MICDSACLIALERIGRLDLLPALFEPVQAPPEVHQEFGLSPDWLRVEAPSDRALVDALGMLVDSGEASALALACEKNQTIILDDRQARAVGKRLSLRIMGTVALLVEAKRRGLLKSVAPVLDMLAEKGFRVSESLRLEALERAGEQSGKTD